MMASPQAPQNPAEQNDTTVPVVYVTSFAPERYNPACLFDIAYLLRSNRHRLMGVCAPETPEESDAGVSRVRELFQVACGSSASDAPLLLGGERLASLLEQVPPGTNVIVTGGFGMVGELLLGRRSLFREQVLRLFVAGGHANDYTSGNAGIRIPIDPVLRDRNPERFLPAGDLALPPGSTEAVAWAAVLTSGEGIIWLPGDICLWRYAAPALLAGGGPLCEFLIQEAARWNLGSGDGSAMGAANSETPVLLSAFPAILLCLQPDPFAWMRFFRAVTARVETDSMGRVSSLAMRSERPNLYAVIAIDGQALGKLVTDLLRETAKP